MSRHTDFYTPFVNNTDTVEMLQQSAPLTILLSLIGTVLFFTSVDAPCCQVWDRHAKAENCVNEFHPPYPIDDKLCKSLAKNEHLEDSLCKKYKNGYRIQCEAQDTAFEFNCKRTCPVPTSKTEAFFSGGAARQHPVGTRVTVLALITSLVFKTLVA